MRRGWFILLLAVSLIGVGCAEPPPLEFVSTQDKFRVRFGSVPKISEKKASGLKTTVYAHKSAEGALSVTVREMPIPDDDPPDRVPLYLAQVRDDMIRTAHGTAISDSSTTLAGKYPGRIFAARLGGDQLGLMRVRIYLVGKLLYQVMAIGTEDYVNSPAATTFLESFMVTE